MSKHHISRAAFARTFPRLVVGRSFLPKKRSELQMLLTSVVFAFEFGRDYSEAQVNTLIKAWVARYGGELGVDHVTLRRYLVDEGILDRDGFGSTYRLAAASPFFSYEPSVRDLDLDALIAQAGAERAARKAAHLAAAEDGDKDES